MDEATGWTSGGAGAPGVHAPLYCDKCERAMRRVLAGALIELRCPCGVVRRTTLADRVVYEEGPAAAAVDAERVRSSIATDPTVVRVPVPCADCGAPDTARAVVGPDMQVIYACACRYKK